MLAIAVKQRPWIGISDNVQVKEQGEFHRKMLENEFQSKMAKSEFDTLMEMKMKFMWLAIYIQMQGPWAKNDIQVSTVTRNTSNEKVKNNIFCVQSTHQFPNSTPSEDAYIVADVRS